MHSWHSDDVWAAIETLKLMGFVVEEQDEDGLVLLFHPSRPGQATVVHNSPDFNRSFLITQLIHAGFDTGRFMQLAGWWQEPEDQLR